LSLFDELVIRDQTLFDVRPDHPGGGEGVLALPAVAALVVSASHKVFVRWAKDAED
jgi:hypothetical protein